MITAKHPVRGPFASCSSGHYYVTKSAATSVFELQLRPYGWEFGAFDMPGDSGVTCAPIQDNGHDVGFASMSWYRLPSGRYEVIGYVA